MVLGKVPVITGQTMKKHGAEGLFGFLTESVTTLINRQRDSLEEENRWA